MTIDLRRYCSLLMCFPLSAIALVGIGCGEATPSLSIGGESDGEIDWSDRRRRMNISARVPGTNETRDLTIEDLVLGVEDDVRSGNGLSADCQQLLNSPPEGEGVPTGCQFDPNPLAISTTPQDCNESACDAQLRLCVANRMMELADVPQFERIVDGFRIGPQDRASQAGLHEAAMEMARETMILTSNALRAAVDDPYGQSCSAGDLADQYVAAPGPTIGEVIGHAMAESYYLMRAAAEKAIDDNLALGDEAFAVEASQTRAARVAYTAPVLSRGRAAQIAIGSDPMLPDGYDGSPLPALRNQPLFSRERPASVSFRMALSLFRDAAPSPAEVLDSENITIDQLAVEGAAEGSLADRLQERYDAEIPNSAEGFYEHFGTSRREMIEAREVLIEELLGFDRDLEQKLVENFSYVSGTLSHARYAATATPPNTPSGRWAALALRRDPADPLVNRLDESSFSGGKLTPQYARRSIAGAIDYALSAASDLLRDNTSAQLSDETLGSFAGLFADIDDRPARIEFSLEDDGTLDIRVLGGSSDTMLVKGTSGLECALRGTVEGQRCKLEHYIVDSPSDFTLGAGSAMGFEGGVGFDGSSLTPSAGDTTTFHVLDGSAAGIDNPTLLGSVPVTNPANWPPGGAPIGGAYTANPWAQEKVRAALEPTRDDPTEALINCAGVDSSQLIPLENELSEDGSGFENSWRTYLTLARQAADEADRLGLEVVAGGLGMDARAEGALDVLAETCGTNIDLDWSRVNLDSDGDGSVDLVGGPCSAGCEAGYVCHQGYCVADPVAGLLAAGSLQDDANLGRLRACLSRAAIWPFASLGTKKLCVWRQEANKTDVCSGEHGSECPFELPEIFESCEKLPPEYLENSSELEIVSVQPLELFESTDGDSEEISSQQRQICDSLRDMRDPNAGPWEKVAASLLLQRNQATMRSDSYARIAPMIHAEYRIGGYSALRLGKRIWNVDLGSLERGPNRGQWPCQSSNGTASISPFADVCNPTDASSFWCRMGDVDCASPAARFAFSDRLVTAVVTAKILGGSTLEGSSIGFAHPEDDFTYWAPERAGLHEFWLRGATLSDPTIGHGATVNQGGFLRYRANEFNMDGYDPGDIEFDLYPFDPASGLGIDSSGWWWASSGTPYIAHYRDEGRVHSLHSDRGRTIRAAALTSGGGRGNPRTTINGNEPPFRLAQVIDDAASGSHVEAHELGAWHHEHKWSCDEERICRQNGDCRVAIFDCEGPVSEFGYYQSGDTNILLAGYREGQVPVTSRHITRRSVLDAAELLCEAPLATTGIARGCGEAPTIGGIDDIPKLVAFLGCAADVFERQGELMVFAEMPHDVASALGQPEPFGAHPGAGGDYGQALSAVRFRMRTLPELQYTVAAKLEQFSAAMSGAEAQLRAVGLSDELRTLELASTVSSQVAACGVAVAQGASIGGAVGGAIASAAITCVNSLVQVGIAFAQAAIEAEQGDLQKQEIISGITGNLLLVVEQIQGAMFALQTSQDAIEGGLISIESARSRGRRAVSRALFADSDASGAVFPVNTTMRRQMNTAVIRYQEAHTRAIRMASLARIALEQRLGVDLNDLSAMAQGGGLTLVEEPANWADDLCTMSGIDFSAIRDSHSLDGSYEDEFVGDYVRKLESVVESYRLDLPFSDGHDRAVVSLRDEILEVRDEGSECVEAAGRRNLLLDGSRFILRSVESGAGEVPSGWSVAGCEPIVLASGADPTVVDCVSAVPLDDEMTPKGVPAAPSIHGGHRLVFGNLLAAAQADGTSVDSTEVSLRSTTEVQQPLVTNPGSTYRVSFYYRPSEFLYHADDPAPSMPVHPTASQLVDVRDAAGVASGFQRGSEPIGLVGAGLSREWFFFKAAEGVDYRLTLRPQPHATAGAEPTNQTIDVAGFMMEDVSHLGVTATSDPLEYPPGLFEHSDTRYAMCEDTDGSAFRKRWVRGCDRVCASGGTGCSSMTTRCYWQADFALDIARDDSRWLASGAGYARGNYNYRTDTMAVNFVGTGVRDCEGVASGSVCYANGSIPYSIYHDSGFLVRNHAGEIYSAPLNPGRIETARGLAAERYITNPTSSADAALLGGYLRREMQGRPTAGNYRIRVWDEPGVDFDRIEDVQLIFDYRYWTRLN